MYYQPIAIKMLYDLSLKTSKYLYGRIQGGFLTKILLNGSFLFWNNDFMVQRWIYALKDGIYLEWNGYEIHIYICVL